MGFEFSINVFGLDLCFEIPNKQKEKPRFEYFGQHNVQIRQTSVKSIVDLYKRKQEVDFDLFLSLY